MNIFLTYVTDTNPISKLPTKKKYMRVFGYNPDDARSAINYVIKTA